MKKIFSVILMFTFMINIQAATAIKNYDETVDVTKEYINDFENNSKYIILKQEMNIPFIFKNGKVGRIPFEKINKYINEIGE